MVDVFSKYAWVEPIKNKTGQAVTTAFEKILKQGQKPIQLQTDDGKEFYNKTFQSLLNKYKIHHFSTSGDTKAVWSSHLIARLNSACIVILRPTIL